MTALRARLPLLVLALLLACGAPAWATRYCDLPGRWSAEHQDRLLRLAAVIKDELERSGAQVALVSRSGVDLSRFDMRYSHAGISLRNHPDTPWAVRQLYFACDIGRSLLFDQGLAAFLMGGDAEGAVYVSVLLLPDEAARALAQAALDNRLALQLLSARYSANAYPFSLSYQNCNQWVLELLAAAWGGLDDGAGPARAQAQDWLQRSGYEPTLFDVGWRPLMWLTAFIPWLHRDDHPDDDLRHSRFRVSMPASIEAFVQARLPQTRRIEFCADADKLVVHPGWSAVGAGCSPDAGDRVEPLLD